MYVFALEIDSNNSAQIAYIAQRTDQLREARIKALDGDDIALRDVIRGLTDLDIRRYRDDILINDMNKLVESGISQDRLIQVLTSMIREGVFIIEKTENENYSHANARGDIDNCLTMLKAFTNHDLFPLLKELFDTKDEFVRNDAIRHYNILMENLQTQKHDKIMHPTIEIPQQQLIKKSVNLNFIWFIIITLLAVISVIVIWRKK